MCLNRASLDKLYETQRQTEKTLSDLRDALRQWKSRIDEVRVQQDGNLNKVLRKFEETARDSADKALEMSVRSVRIVSVFRNLLVLYLPKPLGRMEEFTFWVNTKRQKRL